MSIYDQRLLTPDEEPEIYPYRRVWRSLILENGTLFGLTVAVFVLFNFLNVQLPASLIPAVNGLLVALPVVLWLIFSVWQERFAAEPRPRLITVFVITALAANALAIPVIENLFQPERWLPLGGAISRIVGYTFTVGIVQETVKYAVVRFTTWPQLFRTRLDSVAYGVASALGYAFVLNLRFFLSEPNIMPDVVALQVFNNVAVNVAASLLVSYGLAEVRFDKPTPFMMTIMVAFGALLNGAVIPLRSGLGNAAFSLDGTVPTPIFGGGFSAAILLAFSVIVAFLFSSAERQAREAAGRE
jgi:hypothetical protein